MQTLLLVPTGSGVGLTSASLGLMRALDFIGIKAGFMRPFVQNELTGSDVDRSSQLVARTMNIEPPKAIEQVKLERMLGDDQLDDLMEEVVGTHQGYTEQFDVMVVEGVVPTSQSSYATQVNSGLANALDASIILVSNGDLTEPEKLADKLDMHARGFGGVASSRTVGCLLMRVENLPNYDAKKSSAVIPGDSNIKLADDVISAMQKHSKEVGTEKFPIIGMVPMKESLIAPRTSDVAEAIGAKWLNEGEAGQRRVLKAKLAARTVNNARGVFSKGTLIVTPGDRDDLMLATALASMNGTPMAGLLLTGGLMPNEAMISLCGSALKTGLPVMSVETDSFETVRALTKMSNEIPVDDAERANQVTSFVAAHIDLDWLKAHFAKDRKSRLSPSAFRYQLVKKAQKEKKRIVLPEGAEPRTVEAACICQSRGIADCVLLANPDEVKAVADSLGLTLPEGLEVLEPAPLHEKYIDAMVERRKGKLTAPMAAEYIKDTVVLGTMMLYTGDVDGLVSGAVHTTANTVRPAFQFIKTAPQYSLVSSIFFMLLPEQVLVFGDCAINPNPTSEQLAEIALQSAVSAKAFGISEPKVAMLSYSTGTSGDGEDVEMVAKATEIAKERAKTEQPDVLIDGPMQFDAAYVESVGKKKAPGSEVAGQANVFVFPDLNTGNTTYKAVQRSANVVSVGPMLQGLNKPVNDLSRGALVDDIVYTIALTAIQAMDV